YFENWRYTSVLAYVVLTDSSQLTSDLTRRQVNPTANQFLKFERCHLHMAPAPTAHHTYLDLMVDHHTLDQGPMKGPHPLDQGPTEGPQDIMDQVTLDLDHRDLLTTPQFLESHCHSAIQACLPTLMLNTSSATPGGLYFEVYIDVQGVQRDNCDKNMPYPPQKKKVYKIDKEKTEKDNTFQR
ncbi:unnamed protein product, partial [Timema podura]|nr:unnamed protein product [Timema podura]